MLVGILIGFGIDAAWETHQDHERAAVYLDALSSELQANRQRYENYLGALSNQLAADSEAIQEIVFYEALSNLSGDSRVGVAVRGILPWRRRSPVGPVGAGRLGIAS